LIGLHTTLGYSENSSNTSGTLSVKDGAYIAKIALRRPCGTLITEAAQTANQLVPLTMPHTG
jgi:hypothetical protein